jgi:hypothetical protein
MQCFPNCARNSRSGNSNRKILFTTTESFLHMNSVGVFLLEIYGSDLVSTPLRPSEPSVGSNVERLVTLSRTRCIIT